MREYYGISFEQGASNGSATHAVAPPPDDRGGRVRDIGGRMRQRARAKGQFLTAIAVAGYARREAAKAGDYRRGIPLGQQALRLARQTFGNRDLKTLAILVSLAQLYQLSGRSEEAEPLVREAVLLFQEAMQANRRTLGPRHQQTLMTIVGLAQLYQTLSRHGDAEPLFREALQTSRETLGPRHPQTLISIDGLAQVYQALEPLRRGGTSLPGVAGGEARDARRPSSGHPEQPQCRRFLLPIVGSL